MTRGQQGGEPHGTRGAWLVTRQDDGTVRRERLLTFNPFARPGYRSGASERLGATRRAAWARERERVKRAGQNTCSVGATTRRGGARPPRLTAEQVRAIHELARIRAEERHESGRARAQERAFERAAMVARNSAGGR